jgi:hypothetical protein
MKPICNYLLLILLFVTPFFSLQMQAQKPMGKDGFWVVETNVNTPQKATVYFYNAQHQLVYKEEVQHLPLDLSKAKVRRQLNAVLQQSIAAWKRENNQLLANRIQ